MQRHRRRRHGRRRRVDRERQRERVDARDHARVERRRPGARRGQEQRHEHARGVVRLAAAALARRGGLRARRVGARRAVGAAPVRGRGAAALQVPRHGLDAARRQRRGGDVHAALRLEVRHGGGAHRQRGGRARGEVRRAADLAGEAAEPGGLGARGGGVEAEVEGRQGGRGVAARRGGRVHEGVGLGRRDRDLAQLAGEHALLEGLGLGEHVLVEAVAGAHGRGFGDGGDDVEFPGAVDEDDLLGVALSIADDLRLDRVGDLGHLGREVVERGDITVAQAGGELDVCLVDVLGCALVGAGSGEELVWDHELGLSVRISHGGGGSHTLNGKVYVVPASAMRGWG